MESSRALASRLQEISGKRGSYGRAKISGAKVQVEKDSTGFISRCRICGLSSGPWRNRRKASWSSLLHLKGWHPETLRDRVKYRGNVQ